MPAKWTLRKDGRSSWKLKVGPFWVMVFDETDRYKGDVKVYEIGMYVQGEELRFYKEYNGKKFTDLDVAMEFMEKELKKVLSELKKEIDAFLNNCDGQEEPYASDEWA